MQLVFTVRASWVRPSFRFFFAHGFIPFVAAQRRLSESVHFFEPSSLDCTGRSGFFGP